MWFLFCGKTQEKTYQPRKKTKKIQRKKLNQNHLGRHLESMRASTKRKISKRKQKEKEPWKPTFIHPSPTMFQNVKKSKFTTIHFPSSAAFIRSSSCRDRNPNLQHLCAFSLLLEFPCHCLERWSPLSVNLHCVWVISNLPFCVWDRKKEGSLWMKGLVDEKTQHVKGGLLEVEVLMDDEILGTFTLHNKGIIGLTRKTKEKWWTRNQRSGVEEEHTFWVEFTIWLSMYKTRLCVVSLALYSLAGFPVALKNIPKARLSRNKVIAAFWLQQRTKLRLKTEKKRSHKFSSYRENNLVVSIFNVP